MNQRDKIGQRLMISLAGPELTAEVERLIIETRAGGVIHFGRNITALAQITRLNQDLQDLAARHGLPPLLIAIDEEGGRVSRMPADGQDLVTPSQMAQGAAGPEAAGQAAGIIARNLRRLGFNLNFAPVADINNNPANPVIASRSYGSNPDQVATAVVAAVKAYLAHSIAPCVKHFPGHGDTEVDSHLGLPVLDHDRARLDAIELKPFRAAFEAGVPALMTAHILYPRLDTGGLPATLSPYLLTTLLRHELGFEGLVFSDALDMKAIASRYSPPEATFLTLKAGADVAMPLGTAESQIECARQLAERAADLDLDQPLARLLAFKQRFCLPPSSSPADPAQADAALLLEIARHSLTVVGHNPHLPLPLSRQEARPVIVDFEMPITSVVEEGRRPGPLLLRLLSERWPGLRYFTPSGLDPVSHSAEVFEAVRAASLLVVITRNAHRVAAQAEMLRALVAAHPRAVVVAARDPYDLTLTGDGPLRLATYGDAPASIRALVAALFEEAVLTGQLPVTLA